MSLDTGTGSEFSVSFPSSAEAGLEELIAMLYSTRVINQMFKLAALRSICTYAIFDEDVSDADVSGTFRGRASFLSQLDRTHVVFVHCCRSHLVSLVFESEKASCPDRLVACTRFKLLTRVREVNKVTRNVYSAYGRIW